MIHSIPVKYRLSKEEFLHEHVLKRQPVLIKGALVNWKALNWTPEYLASKIGARKFSYRTEEGTKAGIFSELMHRIIYQQEAGKANVPYLRNIDLNREFPELMQDIQPGLEYCRENWRSHFLMPSNWPHDLRKNLYELFISSVNTSFPYLHIDYWGMSTFLAQFYGEKEFILFPVEDSDKLYPLPVNPLISAIREFDTTEIAEFPKYSEARQFRLKIGPGDLLYNPGWWHTTKTVSTSITLIWAYWNRHEWPKLIEEVKRNYALCSDLKKLALVQYLRLVGAVNSLSH